MRVFVGLAPDNTFLENLFKNIAPLKEEFPEFRWLSEDTLHITLAFIGEIQAGILPQIIKASGIAAGCKKIPAVTGKLRTLPGGKSPNVLALEIDRGGNEIASLASGIACNLEAHGVVFDGNRNRKFLPHITIARRINGKIPANEIHLNVTKGVFGTVNVYESKLSKHGACYSALASFQLMEPFQNPVSFGKDSMA